MRRNGKTRKEKRIISANLEKLEALRAQYKELQVKLRNTLNPEKKKKLRQEIVELRNLTKKIKANLSIPANHLSISSGKKPCPSERESIALAM